MSVSKQGLCSRAFPWVSVKCKGAGAVSPLRAVKRMDFGTEFPVPADGLPPAHEEKVQGALLCPLCHFALKPLGLRPVLGTGGGQGSIV